MLWAERLSFLAVIGTLLAIRPTFVPGGAGTPVLESMKQGINFMRKREGMLSLVSLAFFITMLAYPLMALMPVLAKDVFHGTSNTFTVLLCVSGAGSVTGALLVAGQARKRGKRRKSLEALACVGRSQFWRLGLSRFLPISVGGGLFIGRIDDGGVRVEYVAGAIACGKTDARTGDERLQCGVSRRHADWECWLAAILVEKSSISTVLAGNGILVVLLALYFLFIQKKLTKL